MKILQDFMGCRSLTAIFIGAVLLLSQQIWASEEKDMPICQPAALPPKKLPRSQVYADVVYKQGEVAKYEVAYGALRVLVGYGFLRVQPPVKYAVATHMGDDGHPVNARLYHRVFLAEAYTGEWYKMIFRAKDSLLAYLRPWDSGVSKFYISQNEHKPFVRRYRREKWLDFNHASCQVTVKESEHSKGKHSEDQFFFASGASDALGAFYKLRDYEYEVGKPISFSVYTSEKNWQLVAKPVAIETVMVKAGTFKAAKLELQTFLGEELQQRGKLNVWIDQGTAERPMVKIEGEVTFGKIYLTLESFSPGR